MSSTAVDFTVLSAAERSRLAECERVIERGIGVFVEVGQALTEIRDAKLYRETHATFEAYCRERWRFSGAHAYRLISAADVVESLSPMGEKISPIGEILPTSESVARPLAKLEPDARREVWQEVVENAGGSAPTAAQVKEAVKRRTKPPAPEPGPPPEVDPSPDEGGFDREKELIALIEETARLTEELASHRATDAGREIERLHRLNVGQSSRIATLTTQYNEAARQARRQGKILREVREILGVESDRDIVPRLREMLA